MVALSGEYPVVNAVGTFEVRHSMSGRGTDRWLSIFVARASTSGERGNFDDDGFVVSVLREARQITVRVAFDDVEAEHARSACQSRHDEDGGHRRSGKERDEACSRRNDEPECRRNRNREEDDETQRGDHPNLQPPIRFPLHTMAYVLSDDEIFLRWRKIESEPGSSAKFDQSERRWTVIGISFFGRAVIVAIRSSSASGVSSMWNCW